MRIKKGSVSGQQFTPPLALKMKWSKRKVKISHLGLGKGCLPPLQPPHLAASLF